MAGLVVDDVVRSALALAVSAMDAYFRDKFIDRLIPYAKSHKATVLSPTLKSAGVQMADLLELLGKDRPHRTLRNKIAAWLQAQPMHDLNRVDKLFKPFGLPNLTTDAINVANASKKRGAAFGRSTVEKVVSRRHEIVHYADYFAGKNDLQKIDADRVLRQIDYVRRLVESADGLIDSATRSTKRGKRKSK